MWAAASDSGPFGAIVELLLLTAQRREKVATMRWSDIVDGVWTIATENRGEGQRRGAPAAVRRSGAHSPPGRSHEQYLSFAGRRTAARRTAVGRGRPASIVGRRKARLDARLPRTPAHWTITTYGTVAVLCRGQAFRATAPSAY